MLRLDSLRIAGFFFPAAYPFPHRRVLLHSEGAAVQCALGFLDNQTITRSRENPVPGKKSCQPQNAETEEG
jgi:hypothetical protein